MESTLKTLIDKIYDDAIAKAKLDADKIIENAKKESQYILQSAQEEANQILEKAKIESKILKESTEADLKNAKTQTLVTLKNEIKNLISKQILDSSIKELNMNLEFLKDLIMKITDYWLKNGVLPENIELIIPENKKQEWETILKSNILQKLNGLKITYTGIKSGFQIKREDLGFCLDFTEEAMKEFFKLFLRKKTEEWLF